MKSAMLIKGGAMALVLAAGQSAMAQKVRHAANEVANMGPQPIYNAPQPEALGDVLAGPINVETFIGHTGVLGVDHAWGFYWVSSRVLPAGSAHTIAKFDKNGVGQAQFQQGPGATSSSWGGRDGASNEAANKLYFGHEGGVLMEYTYNPGTGNIAFTAQHNIPLPGAPTIRALAYNPTTDSFYTANFGSAIWEFKINPPQLLNTFPNLAGPQGVAGALYGLAYNEANGKVWGFSQNACGPGGGSTQSVYFQELDPAAAMTPTTRSFCGSAGPDPLTSIAGGMDIYCGDPRNPGKLSAVALHQSTPDSLFVYDISDNCGAAPCYPDCNGDGNLNLADFGCFQTKFALGDPYADCNGDGNLNLADFGCFQTKFALGCP